MKAYGSKFQVHILEVIDKKLSSQFGGHLKIYISWKGRGRQLWKRHQYSPALGTKQLSLCLTFQVKDP